MSQLLEQLLNSKKVLSSRVKGAELLLTAVQSCTPKLMVGSASLEMDRGTAEHLILTEIEEAKDQLAKVDRQLAAAEAAVESV